MARLFITAREIDLISDLTKEIIKDVGITRVPDTLLNKINQAVQ